MKKPYQRPQLYTIGHDGPEPHEWPTWVRRLDEIVSAERLRTEAAVRGRGRLKEECRHG